MSWFNREPPLPRLLTDDERTELCDRILADFIVNDIGEIIRGGGTPATLCALMERIMISVITTNISILRIEPGHAVELAELAFDRVLEQVHPVHIRMEEQMKKYRTQR